MTCDLFLQTPDSVEIVPQGVADGNGEDAADHDGGMETRVFIFDFGRRMKQYKTAYSRGQHFSPDRMFRIRNIRFSPDRIFCMWHAACGTFGRAHA